MRWDLDPIDGGTRVVLLHRPLRPEPAIDVCTGWHVMLDALDAHLDGRDPNAVPPDFAGSTGSTPASSADRRRSRNRVGRVEVPLGQLDLPSYRIVV